MVCFLSGIVDAGKEINENFEWFFNIFGFVGGLVGIIGGIITWIKKQRADSSKKINWKRTAFLAVVIIFCSVLFISSLLNIVSFFDAERNRGGHGGGSVSPGEIIPDPPEPVSSESELPEPVLADAVDFEYTVENGGVAITKYVGSNESIIVPSEMNGEPVVMIKQDAFSENASLKNITFSNGTMILEDLAINKCPNLLNISIATSTKIKYRIGEQCPKLTSINVDEFNPNYTSENGILFTKDKNTILKYPEGLTDKKYVIPESVTVLWGSSMAYAPFEELVIHDNVTRIYGAAFYECKKLQ